MKKIFNNADTLGVIRLEFQRIFTGWNFYAAVIVTTALVLYQTFSKNNYAGSVISGLVKMSALSFICRLMTMSSAFPAASSYCDDCIGKYYNPIVNRSGISSYINGKFISCFLSSFLVCFISLILYTIIGSMLFINGIGTQIKLYNEPNSIFYGMIKCSGLIYVIFHILIYSGTIAVFSLYGLVISAYMTNRFVAVTAPLLSCILLDEITSYLPNFCSLFSFGKLSSKITDTPVKFIALYTAVMLVYIVIAKYLYTKRVRRKLGNEIV